ncbi:chemotaxis protein CheW [Desulfococcaceae bacterium HSG7]|nr:chemotaxis protein CheW [Desulfococcaceae bacterium HSG9]MDM8553912.1 chemotaxis protein CheW [Desulfococcaceae bacterium HSG7]
MADSYFNANENEDLSEDSQLAQLVGFVIGKELFGVSILMVQEIIRSAPITAVPNSPDFIEGIINLRGSIVPVIDLRKRLGLYGDDKITDEDIWILILNIDGRTTGFIVDSVTQVLKIDENTLEPPPDIVVARLESQYIRGVCKLDEDLLILLDFTCILMVDEFKKLKEVVAA